MSCGGGVSAFEQKKQALINVNIWKSNFISLWRKYGTFKDVGGVECFDYYRIDGDDDGPEKMSIHLKQATLHDDVKNDDLEWVHLIFNFAKFVNMTPDNIDKWIEYMQGEVENYEFDHLTYNIADLKVVDYNFYKDGNIVEDEFMQNLAMLIAYRKLVDVKEVYNGVNNTSRDYSYDEDVDIDAVKAMVPPLADYEYGTTDATSDTIYFKVTFVNKFIAGYLMEKGIGTDVLDALVMDGVLIGLGDVGASSMTYAFSVDKAKKMSGFDFVKVVQNALDFYYKEVSHWYDFFVDMIGFILAGIAVYFGQYELAIGLLASAVASYTGSKIFKIIATIVSIVTSGGLTSLANLSISEAVNLVLNVYSLYMELKYNPADGTDKIDDTTANSPEMFYKMPYEAYSGIYCYKELTRVSVSSVY